MNLQSINVSSINTSINTSINNYNFPRNEFKDITAYWDDNSLFDRFHGTNGFSKRDDVFVGDYFNCGTVIRAPDSIYEGTSWLTIVGINTLMYKGRNPNRSEGTQVAGEDWINYEHMILMPGKGKEGLCFGSGQMYATTPFTGGYAGSKMYLNLLGGSSVSTSGTINYQLYQVFGSHLKPSWHFCSCGNNSTSWNHLGSASGASTSWNWCLGYSWLPTETEVNGSISASSSIFDTGTGNHQFSLFAFCEEARGCRGKKYHYWLRDVASGSHFALQLYIGVSDYFAATRVDGVRPWLLVS